MYEENTQEAAQKRAQRRIVANLSVSYRIVDEDDISDAKTIIDSSEAKKGNLDTTLAFLGLSASEEEINPALLEILKQINRKLDILISKSEPENVIPDAKNCFTHDISSESISLVCDIPVGKRIIASIDFRPAFDKIYFIGKVIRQSTNDKLISVIKFEYISERAKQTIVYYMFSLERRLIKKEKQ